MNKIIHKFSLLMGLFVISTSLLLANNLKMSGILLVPPPCTIQNDQVIQVFFGDNVGLHKVDGINYTQEINYQLDCQPNTKGWDLMLSLRGAKSIFDDAALQTSAKDLAIRMTQDGKAFEINKPIKINYGSKPELKAVLIKTPGSTLSEGAFTVTATLLAEYQ